MSQVVEMAPTPDHPTSYAKRTHREVRFGNYILGSTLGEGEFGKVKLGWRKDGKQPSQVAIKLIKRDTLMRDHESEIKIHREINSLKLLSHPNIVNLVEVMKSGKYIGIVLEYASGGELFDYILHHKYLKENVAKKLFAQLVSGVDYMHLKGLIHRDLKLENLLLDKHKNVVISDFGFVNSYNRDKNDLMKTSCGSPCYAAPELVLTQTPYEGRKVDIWSLGVILYAMLSGYLPFDDDPDNEDGADIVKLYHYICKTPLTFPEYVSPLARDLLRKIIVPDPKKRIDINAIRNHPWLSPHANLLSVRQPEWDRIHRDQKPSPVVAPAKQKRFSMINERTNSSSLMMNPHGRSFSSTNIIYPPSVGPTTSSSLANAVAVPEDSPSPSSSSRSSPTTSSPTKQFVRGHAKSASISNTYSPASSALKAVVDSKRNSLDLSAIDAPQLAPPKSYTHLPAQVPRSSTYTGTPITTIVETSVAAPRTPLNGTFTASPQSPSSSKLPQHKKPRPTSYHPLSMSSTTFDAVMPLSDQVKIPSPLLHYSSFLSTSPTRTSPISERDSDKLPEADVSRRNSVVTHVHVNGVLTDSLNTHENKRNSVLSYLEDKMESLDLTESHSPTKTAKVDSLDVSAIETPQINQQPTFDTQSESPISAKLPETELPNEKEVEQPTNTSQETIDTKTESQESEKPLTPVDQSPVATPGSVTPPSDVDVLPHLAPALSPHSVRAQAAQDEAVRQIESAKEARDAARKVSRAQSVKKRDVSRQNSVSRTPSDAKARQAARSRDSNKENRDTKKRNRFSILSFYSTYETTPKKVLEPSSDANVIKPDKEKRLASSDTTRRQLVAPADPSANGKEASAARKVMEFFKRRSIRIG